MGLLTKLLELFESKAHRVNRLAAEEEQRVRFAQQVLAAEKQKAAFREASALISVCAENRYDAALALLDNGARVNGKNAHGETPLLVAVFASLSTIRSARNRGAEEALDTRLIDLLLSRGAERQPVIDRLKTESRKSRDFAQTAGPVVDAHQSQMLQRFGRASDFDYLGTQDERDRQRVIDYLR